MSAPICPYCQQPARLVTGAAIYRHRPDLYSLKFWQCQPCDAYVGCHKNGDGAQPLGRLANAQLRMWKQNAHAVFDPFWQQPLNAEIASRDGHAPRGIKQKYRSIAYSRLAQALDIPASECHIGMFDVDTCKRVVEICRGWITERQGGVF